VSIVVSPQAQADLREVRSYIARDNPAAARREVARIKEAIKMHAGGRVDASIRVAMASCSRRSTGFAALVIAPTGAALSAEGESDQA